MIDRAIHEAYAQKGVAVVVLLMTLGLHKFPMLSMIQLLQLTKTAPEPVATDTEVSEFLDMVKSANVLLFMLVVN